MGGKAKRRFFIEPLTSVEKETLTAFLLRRGSIGELTPTQKTVLGRLLTALEKAPEVPPISSVEVSTLIGLVELNLDTKKHARRLQEWLSAVYTYYRKKET